MQKIAYTHQKEVANQQEDMEVWGKDSHLMEKVSLRGGGAGLGLC